MHKNFYDALYDACFCKENRTKRVCEVFNNFKDKLIKDYVDYFLGVDAASNALRILTQRKQNSPFQKKLEQCKPDKKYSGFSLANLLLQPFQRLSKYHLMLERLFKLREPKKNGRGSELEDETMNYIKETWKAAGVLNAYLNEIKRDQEEFQNIKKISNSLNIPLEDLKEIGRLKMEDRFDVKTASDKTGVNRTVFLFEKEIILVEKSLFGKHRIVEKIPIYEIKDIDFTSYNSIFLLMTDGLRKYEFSFKNIDHKKVWRKSIDLLIVRDRLSNNHVFTLSNFGKDLQKCAVCNGFLNGFFFQGYKCDYCEIRVHKECLSQTALCKGNFHNINNKVFKVINFRER